VSTAPKLLVSGATGNVGGELLKLLRASHADVRVIARDRTRATFPAGTDVAVGDLDDPKSLGAAAEGVQAAFLLGGRRDMPGLLAELEGAGVEHVVVLTSRSVIGGVRGNAIVDMWSTTEDAVRASGMSWTLLRPSGFMSNALRWRSQLASGDVVRATFANAAIAAIDPLDIAAVAAIALTDRDHASRALELSGPSPLLPAAQVAILARALGRPLRFEAITGEDALVELGRNFSPAFAEAQIRFFDRGEFDDARVVSTVRELLGRPPGTFEQWATANARAFRHD
jgi:uncharacterized protein YbjT (DUF2867 family)